MTLAWNFLSQYMQDHAFGFLQHGKFNWQGELSYISQRKHTMWLYQRRYNDYTVFGYTVSSNRAGTQDTNPPQSNSSVPSLQSYFLSHLRLRSMHSPLLHSHWDSVHGTGVGVVGTAGWGGKHTVKQKLVKAKSLIQSQTTKTRKQTTKVLKWLKERKIFLKNEGNNEGNFHSSGF